MKKLSTLCAVAAVAFLSGCAYSTTLVEKPADSEAFAPVAPKPSAICAVVSATKATVNGNEGTPSQEFVKRVAGKLSEVGIFTTVATDTAAAKSECADIKLRFDETVDPHQGGNMSKAFLTGLTLYILSPALQLSHDYGQKITVDATLPGRPAKQYVAETKGEASYMIYANRALLTSELTSKVTTSNLNSIANQISGDGGFSK